MDITDRIFSMLKERNIKAVQLARYVGVSEGNVGDWRNKRSRPGIDALPKIADFFDVSIDYLVTGKEYERGKGAND